MIKKMFDKFEDKIILHKVALSLVLLTLVTVFCLVSTKYVSSAEKITVSGRVVAFEDLNVGIAGVMVFIKEATATDVIGSPGTYTITTNASGYFSKQINLEKGPCSSNCQYAVRVIGVPTDRSSTPYIYDISDLTKGFGETIPGTRIVPHPDGTCQREPALPQLHLVGESSYECQPIVDNTGCEFGGRCAFALKLLNVCGDGTLGGTETCESTHPYYQDTGCPYGETCCNTVSNANECRTYPGPRCGDGVGDPFNNANIDSGYEECDGGDGVNGTECIPGEPGTCRYCKEDCTIGRVTNGADIPLVVTGGLVALGSGDGSAIELNRNLIFYSPTDGELYYGDNGANVFNDNMSPSEAIFYDPRYLDIYRNILGSFGNIQFRESGVQ